MKDKNKGNLKMNEKGKKIASIKIEKKWIQRMYKSKDKQVN